MYVWRWYQIRLNILDTAIQLTFQLDTGFRKHPAGLTNFQLGEFQKSGTFRAMIAVLLLMINCKI